MRIDTVTFEFDNLQEVRSQVLDLVRDEPSTVVYCIGKIFVLEMRLNPLELYHFRKVFDGAGIKYAAKVK